MPLESVLQRRFIAFVLDCIIFYFLVLTPMLSSLLVFMGIKNPTMEVFDNPTIMSGFGAAIAIVLPFFVFYKSIFEYSLAQTPGKKLLGLKVEGISGFGESVLRNLPFLFPLISIVDLAPMVFSDQRLFESLSNTQVLNSMGEGE